MTGVAGQAWFLPEGVGAVALSRCASPAGRCSDSPRGSLPSPVAALPAGLLVYGFPLSSTTWTVGDEPDTPKLGKTTCRLLDGHDVA